MLRSLPHGPFQHGQKGREPLRGADITVLRNATIEGLCCMNWLVPGPTHTRGRGIHEGVSENQGWESQGSS